MSTQSRAIRRRAARASAKLDRKVTVKLQGRTPTEAFGRGLDEMAEEAGRRIKVGRCIQLGKWRTLVIFTAKPRKS